MAWKLTCVVLACVALWILWGWSQNGRWVLSTQENRPPVVLDTRTGDLYGWVDKFVRTTAEKKRKREM